MIRVDELYNNTFWPWIAKNIELPTRMWFCDPPGRSDPDSLFNFGQDIDIEQHYIFFHDQEPIHLDTHRPLFEAVKSQNLDIQGQQGIVTSEWNSEFVTEVCDTFGWQNYYYFYHGWAAQDWYRGYHRTFLITPPEQRSISRSFINPNRIIGGKRDHRVLLLYHLFRHGVRNAWISCPRHCVFENQSIQNIGSRYQDRYPDIGAVLTDAPVPMHFPGEQDHPMHSCWLSLFDQTAQTLAYVVTETVCFGRRNHITEKTFKPICQQLPFILVSTAGSLEYLRRYGFQTFGDLWDESYDEETDDLIRIEKVAKILIELDSLTPQELQSLYHAALPAVQHNFRHFYGGDFEKLLWSEMTQMLDTIQHDFRI